MTINQELITINFNKGRGSDSVKWIALHKQEGNGDLKGWFSNPNAKVSSHYQIMKSGQINQFVQDGDTAWCTYGINSRSIGIEHEGLANDTITDQEYQSSIELVASLCKKYNIPAIHINTDGINAGIKGIVIHREVPNNSTSCPANLDYMRIINGANSLINGTNMFDFNIYLEGSNTMLKVTSGSVSANATIKNVTKGNSWTVFFNRDSSAPPAVINSATEQCLYEVTLGGVTKQLDNRPVVVPPPEPTPLEKLQIEFNKLNEENNNNKTKISDLTKAKSDLQTSYDTLYDKEVLEAQAVKDLTVRISDLEKITPKATETIIDKERLAKLEDEDSKFEALTTRVDTLQTKNDELTNKLKLYEGIGGIFQTIKDLFDKIFHKGD